jgi:hypothetical protein
MYFATDNGTVIAALGTTPMKFLLIFLPILALSLGRLSAIGITLDRIQFTIGPTQLEVSAPFSHFSADNLADPSQDPNFDIDWGFTNTEEFANFNGHLYVRGGELFSSATLRFTLTEAVNFLVTGGIRQPEWLSVSFTSLSAALGPVGPGVTYGSSMSALDFGIGSLPSLSGTFNPGQYLFIANGFAYATESDSHIGLQLTPIATPDGGSTLMLLGLAICAIGGIFGKLRALSNC